MPKDLVDTVSTKADLTIVQSQWSKVGLIAQGAPEDRLRVLYHGVDPAVFHPGEGDREKTGLPDGPLLLSVVSNTERKGIPLTMVILAKLLGQGHDLRLYLHTPREGFYGLDTHANALGLAGKDRVFTKATSDPSPVNLSGADDAEMANLYRTASVYVTTTYGEGQGVPILEALACGLPAVMTDTPILRELYGAFPHSRFINATQNFPVPWGFDWFPDVEDGVRKVEEALDMPRPTSVEIPSFFLWKNIVRTLMGYLEDLTNGG
jgi:glycosyltransferase involved in cell wall biosynthesis